MNKSLPAQSVVEERECSRGISTRTHRRLGSGGGYLARWKLRKYSYLTCTFVILTDLGRGLSLISRPPRRSRRGRVCTRLRAWWNRLSNNSTGHISPADD